MYSNVTLKSGNMIVKTGDLVGFTLGWPEQKGEYKAIILEKVFQSHFPDTFKACIIEVKKQNPWMQRHVGQIIEINLREIEEIISDAPKTQLISGELSK
jgi:hypothetical protein